MQTYEFCLQFSNTSKDYNRVFNGRRLKDKKLHVRIEALNPFTATADARFNTDDSTNAADVICTLFLASVSKANPDVQMDETGIPEILWPKKSRKQTHAALLKSIRDEIAKTLCDKAVMIKNDDAYASGQKYLLTIEFKPTQLRKDYKVKFEYYTHEKQKAHLLEKRAKTVVRFDSVNLPAFEGAKDDQQLHVALSGGTEATMLVNMSSDKTKAVFVCCREGEVFAVLSFTRTTLGWGTASQDDNNWKLMAQILRNSGKEAEAAGKEMGNIIKLRPHHLSYILSGIASHTLAAGCLPEPVAAVCKMGCSFCSEPVNSRFKMGMTALIGDPCNKLDDSSNDLLELPCKSGMWSVERIKNKKGKVGAVVFLNETYRSVQALSMNRDILGALEQNEDKFYTEYYTVPVDSGMIGIYNKEELGDKIGTHLEFYPNVCEMTSMHADEDDYQGQANYLERGYIASTINGDGPYTVHVTRDKETNELVRVQITL